MIIIYMALENNKMGRRYKKYQFGKETQIFYIAVTSLYFDELR